MKMESPRTCTTSCRTEEENAQGILTIFLGQPSCESISVKLHSKTRRGVHWLVHVLNVLPVPLMLISIPWESS